MQYIFILYLIWNVFNTFKKWSISAGFILLKNYMVQTFRIFKANYFLLTKFYDFLIKKIYILLKKIQWVLSQFLPSQLPKFKSTGWVVEGINKFEFLIKLMPCVVDSRNGIKIRSIFSMLNIQVYFYSS